MRTPPDRFEDLSSAYGDRDDTLSRPAALLVIIYALTVGWLVALLGLLWGMCRCGERSATREI